MPERSETDKQLAAQNNIDFADDKSMPVDSISFESDLPSILGMAVKGYVSFTETPAVLHVPIPRARAIEALAALAHEQRVAWMSDLLTKEEIDPDRVARWGQLIDTKYADLPEGKRGMSRAWAKAAIHRFLNILEEFNLVLKFADDKE